MSALRLLARWRQAKYRAPFPAEWRTDLAAQMPLYRRMPGALREQLEPVARRFMHRTAFIGCGGLEITDSMRRIVAIEAALLVVHRDPRAFDSLYSVLIYPDQFVVEERDEDEFGLVTEGVQAVSGQAIDTSNIVIAWKDVESGFAEAAGYNVVIHELAHHLDHLTEGAASTHATLRQDYEALCAAVDRGEDTVIDPYGAEDPAEFLATASEAFFERAREFRAAHPSLHASLRTFYGVDPAAWD